MDRNTSGEDKREGTQNIIDRLKALFPGTCRHQNRRVLRYLRASELWKDGSPEIVFETKVSRCRDCGEIFLDKDLRRHEPKLREAHDIFSQVVGELGEINISIGGPSKRISSQGEDISTLIVPQFIPRNPRFRLSDVILPAQTQIQISEALAKVVHHDTIYRKWGFERVDPVGRGVVLNFIGPPGTGKTRCAEAFAGELGLSFLQVSLDEIESRFMGETPKNIRSAFESARKSGAVLFFDEADTVLGKRLSAVTQGADHEINLERATMLMELDVHEGIVIFASNFPQNYDPAFRRRIAHHIEFYLPDEDARRRLWEYHLVPGIPLAEDRNELIRKAVALTEGLSGGDILTCLRLALPSCLLEGGDNAKLGIKHIEAAVDRIKVARSRIGRDDGDEGTSRHQALRSLFGIPAPPAEGLGGKAQDEK